MENPMYEREAVIHDLALAQASFLVANIAPSAAMLCDGNQDRYIEDVIKSSILIAEAMDDFMHDDAYREAIVAKGMQIVEERARAEAEAG